MFASEKRGCFGRHATRTGAIAQILAKICTPATTKTYRSLVFLLPPSFVFLGNSRMFRIRARMKIVIFAENLECHSGFQRSTTRRDRFTLSSFFFFSSSSSFHIESPRSSSRENSEPILARRIYRNGARCAKMLTVRKSNS